jgi:hypothetical protein
MKTETYYCDFCSGFGKQKVVLLGEVAAGCNNIEVYICRSCLKQANEIIKTATKDSGASTG